MLPEGAVVGANLRALGAALLWCHSCTAIVVAPVVVGLHVGLTVRAHVLRLAGKLGSRFRGTVEERIGWPGRNFNLKETRGKGEAFKLKEVQSTSSELATRE